MKYFALFALGTLTAFAQTDLSPKARFANDAQKVMGHLKIYGQQTRTIDDELLNGVLSFQTGPFSKKTYEGAALLGYQTERAERFKAAVLQFQKLTQEEQVYVLASGFVHYSYEEGPKIFGVSHSHASSIHIPFYNLVASQALYFYLRHTIQMLQELAKTPDIDGHSLDLIKNAISAAISLDEEISGQNFDPTRSMYSTSNPNIAFYVHLRNGYMQLWEAQNFSIPETLMPKGDEGAARILEENRKQAHHAYHAYPKDPSNRYPADLMDIKRRGDDSIPELRERVQSLKDSIRALDAIQDKLPQTQGPNKSGVLGTYEKLQALADVIAMWNETALWTLGQDFAIARKLLPHGVEK